MVYNFYDWDNTLVFTNKALYFAYLEALKPYGFDFSYTYFMKAIYNDSTAYMRGKGLSESIIKKVKVNKEELIETEFYKLIQKNEAITLDRNQFNAIVTNTSAVFVRSLLQTKVAIDHNYFSFLLGSDMVKFRKPYPNLYIEAFKKISKDFDYDKDELRIYEDSLEGLEAATKFLRELKDGYNGFKEIKNFKLIHV
jgi:beta-phosphoglucomutase-like phosphatase (HAD superfamily)